MIDNGAIPLGRFYPERLERVANVLVRLEYRFPDSCEMRRVLHLPLPDEGDLSLIDLMCGSVDDMRRARSAMDAIESPKTKWYRYGHR